jgi:thiol:disulfide interchange protein DsbA
MNRLVTLILALALPLAACEANPPPPAPEAPPAAEAPADAGQPAETATQAPADEAKIDELASVEEPAGEAAASDAPMMTAQAPAADTAAAPFQEGKNYTRLPAAQPTSSPPDTIEVAEAFMYSCPHCAAFEPQLSRWVSGKPANVSFVRLPVNFNQVAALHMRAFYAAETLGVLDSIHQAFFDEIHVKKNPLSDVESLTKFFVAHGVDPKAFTDTMSSFAIDTKMRKAETLLRRYQIASVPAIIINGKYKTDVSMAGGYAQIFQLIDFLIKKEQEAGAGEAPAASSG